MNSIVRQYVFGAIIIAVGLYRLYTGVMVDFGLYVTAGAAFIFNGLTLEPKLASFKKLLIIITWVLIITAGIFFFLVARRMF